MHNNYLKILQNYFLIELCQKWVWVEKEIMEIQEDFRFSYNIFYFYTKEAN